MAPILDRLLPLEAKTVRRLRMVVPAAAMLLWSVVAFAAGRPVGVRRAGLDRAGRRLDARVGRRRRAGRPTDPPPTGAARWCRRRWVRCPTGVATVLARGPDLVVLGLLPVWIAVLLRHRQRAPAAYAQIVLAVIAVAIASSIRTRSLMERMMDAQEQEQGGSAPVTRIVAGTVGGRILQVPAPGTRPTSERVREALFSRLEHLDVVDGARVLDLYAGSGALGIEAASRGAAHVTLVESARDAADVCRRNVAALGLADRGRRWSRSGPSGSCSGRPRRPGTSCSSTRPYDLTEADLRRPSWRPRRLLSAHGVRGRRAGVAARPSRAWPDGLGASRPARVRRHRHVVRGARRPGPCSTVRRGPPRSTSPTGGSRPFVERQVRGSVVARYVARSSSRAAATPASSRNRPMPRPWCSGSTAR